jgi:hypothetical protein
MHQQPSAMHPQTSAMHPTGCAYSSVCILLCLILTEHLLTITLFPFPVLSRVTGGVKIVNFIAEDTDETGTPYAGVIPIEKALDPFGDAILA